MRKPSCSAHGRLTTAAHPRPGSHVHGSDGSTADVEGTGGIDVNGRRQRALLLTFVLLVVVCSVVVALSLV
jgi:hypothetical protein